MLWLLSALLSPLHAGSSMLAMILCFKLLNIHRWPTPAYRSPITRQVAPKLKAAIQQQSFSMVRPAGVGHEQSFGH